MRIATIGLIAMFCVGCTTDADQLTEQTLQGLQLKVPEQFPTIQEAVDAAMAGDTIVVSPGDYYENIDVHTSMNLHGAGPGQTVLHGTMDIGGFGVCEPACEVTGFTIVAQEGQGGTAMDFGVSPFKVFGNVIEGFGSGFHCENAGLGEVSGNLIRLNEVGIRLTESIDVEIFNNVVVNNSHAGIRIGGSCAPIIRHNTIVGNGFGSDYSFGGAGLVYVTGNQEYTYNNIIVSNKGGINTIKGSQSVDNGHNLVWGNVVNYVGQAGPSPGDVSKDPKFKDAAEKEFHLQEGSPAIDAGLDLGIDTDFDGTPRAGLGHDLGAFEFLPIAEGGDFVITEVMANPVDESKGEFLEFFNATASTLDVAGLTLYDGDNTDKVVGYDGGSTEVPAGSYAVLLDPDYAQIAVPYDIPEDAVLLSVTDKGIGSGLSTSDPVTLMRNGAVISTYNHPFNPGNGLSAERVDPSLPDDPENWVPSPCGSSPGSASCIASGEGPDDVPPLAITEVMSVAWTPDGEFIEFYNYGEEPVDMAGLVIADGDTTDVLVPVNGKSSMVPPGVHGLAVDPDLVPNMGDAPYFLAESVPVVTVSDTALCNTLSKNDPITLLTADGASVISTYSHPVSSWQQSVERTDPLDPDVPGSWILSPCLEKHSAGQANCAYGSAEPVETPLLIINEVMANAVNEDTGEFIELFNPSGEDVDVAGLMFSDGDASDVIGPFSPAGTTMIPAGGYGVILDPEYSGAYAIAASAIMLAPQNTTLGNGLSTTDPVTLLASDGLTKLSAFSHPFNPGNGLSVERKGDSGDVESNWVASTCASGSSPGAANCATGGAEPDPDPDSTKLTISEVMANPIDEATGEFVELVNLESETVDLAGYYLSDGDAVDPILGFDGGPTEVPAGGIAVILDSSYPNDGPYIFPAEAVLLTTDDASLGSGLSVNDPIALLAPNGVTVLSAYNFPFNPGNGTSAERVDLEAADAPENWVPSSCETGSSPGATNCSAGEPILPDVTVVDINAANQAELELVSGIGPATAAAIVAYRDNNGSYETLSQLCVLDGVSLDMVAGWKVSEDGEKPYVIGMEGEKPVKVFTKVATLQTALPATWAPEAGAWIGRPVRLQRAAVLTELDMESNQEFLFGDWGDEGEFEPGGNAKIPVRLEKAATKNSYLRDQTNLANATADWNKEDGDPYLSPDFYRWAEPLPGWGMVPYAHVFALEGIMDIIDDQWTVVIRAADAPGIDRLVMIERWLAPESWKKLEVVWTYNYKPAVVESTSGYSYSLPYRLVLAHPCRQFWADLNGEWIEIDRCEKFGECADCSISWATFNSAINAWNDTPLVGDGYCFKYKKVDYCFSLEEEDIGVDILNNASIVELKGHCYTTQLANVLIKNRPHVSIKGYDLVYGVGDKSLWNLLICYIRSGQWPPAAEGTVQKVIQDIPGNEYKKVLINEASVSSVNGFNCTICDPGTGHCITVHTWGSFPATLSPGDLVTVVAKVSYYLKGGYWELELIDVPSFYISILQEG